MGGWFDPIDRLRLWMAMVSPAVKSPLDQSQKAAARVGVVHVTARQRIVAVRFSGWVGSERGPIP